MRTSLWHQNAGIHRSSSCRVHEVIIWGRETRRHIHKKKKMVGKDLKKKKKNPIFVSVVFSVIRRSTCTSTPTKGGGGGGNGKGGGDNGEALLHHISGPVRQKKAFRPHQQVIRISITVTNVINMMNWRVCTLFVRYTGIKESIAQSDAQP